MNEQGTPIWWDGFQVPLRPELSSDCSADVCVIGAGIAGMTTAYLLAKAGKRVVVLESKKIGGGMSGFTTAHLTNALDDRYSRLERFHGAEGIKFAAASHSAAIDQIESIVRAESIDCDFLRLDGYLFAPPGYKGMELHDEYHAARRAGLKSIEKVERAPIDAFDTGVAIRFPDQGQFHPLKYLSGLADAIEALGGSIYCGTHAAKVEGGEHALVETAAGPIVRAKAIVVATNVPINDRLVIHTKQAPYTTYVIGVEVPRGSVEPALYWDTRQEADDDSPQVPYHYARLAGIEAALSVNDILIVGGEDHKTAQSDRGADECFARLEAWTKERWPEAGQTVFRWSGQVMEPSDGMAFIGRNPMDKDNVYVVTGDSGNGMTHGTVAGMLLTDLILGRRNAWEKLYDPSRIKLQTTAKFIKENVNVAGQLINTAFGSSDVDDEELIAAGEGAVIRRGIKRIAIYRDDEGEVHEMSAVCPHLGCTVGWNTVEKTWDCPCHGSRFDCAGEVINGPANVGLAHIDEDSGGRRRGPEREDRTPLR